MVIQLPPMMPLPKHAFYCHELTTTTPNGYVRPIGMHKTERFRGEKRAFAVLSQCRHDDGRFEDRDIFVCKKKQSYPAMHCR